MDGVEVRAMPGKPVLVIRFPDGTVRNCAFMGEADLHDFVARELIVGLNVVLVMQHASMGGDPMAAPKVRVDA